ncbi:MAG: hypothetical protein GY810_04940 [Aureispira sp.]|nr:hypothetical protein [Aureispira sp.]
MFKIGFAKEEITYFKENAGFLGYIVPHNIAKGVASPIYCRATVLDDNQGTLVAIAVVELAFCTSKLKHEILLALEEELPGIFTGANLMIPAQHTHSTIGGYSQFFFHNILIPGYDHDACMTYTKGIVKAIVAAYYNRQASSVHIARSSFEPSSMVAFNRSIKAYNNNPENTEKVTKKEAAYALDLTMKQLEVTDHNGQLTGILNWFGCHPTSLSNKNTLISPDNKGFASAKLEATLNDKNDTEHETVTAFLQNASGDVTPNFIWEPRKVRKQFKDDFEKMEFNGELQYQKALEITEQATPEKQLVSGGLDYTIAYIDMSNVTVNPEFTPNKEEFRRTSNPCLGVSFLQGTKEGPVMSKPLGMFTRIVNRNIKLFDPFFIKALEKPDLVHLYNSQYPKSTTIDAGAGRIMGTQNIKRFFIPSFVDPVIRNLKVIHRQGAYMINKPWLPEIVAIQLISIGNICLIGLPCEITTTAGKRLKQTVLESLKDKGIEEVILCSLTNDYSGYTTTFEEYQVQAYEGGHTLYGKWTLAAYQTQFKKLCKEFCKPTEEREDIGHPEIPILLDEQLWKGTMEVLKAKK